MLYSALSVIAFIIRSSVDRIFMSPSQVTQMLVHDTFESRQVVEKPTNPESLTLEAWSSGYLVGALVIMGFITIANMRKGVLLHKVSVTNIPRSCDTKLSLACSSRGTESKRIIFPPSWLMKI